MTFQCRKGIMSTPKKYGGTFLKAFHGRWETNFGGQIYWGAVLHGGLLMIRSCQGRISFTNTFSGN